MTALVIRVDLAAARHVLPRQQTWRQVWRAEDPLLCPLSPGAEWCDYQKTEPATTAPKTIRATPIVAETRWPCGNTFSANTTKVSTSIQPKLIVPATSVNHTVVLRLA